MATTFLEAAPRYATYGLAAGVGARLLKNLFDVGRRGSQDEVESLNLSEDPVTSVPMQVSPEEAEELRKSGIKVRKVLKKVPSETKLAADDSLGAVAKIGLGATAAAGALGAWKFSDWLLDKTRKGMIEDDLNKLRKRVKRVVDDQPGEADIPLHAYMKAAEDHYFNKQASDVVATGVDRVAGAAIPDPILQALGGIGVFGLVAAYKSMSDESKYKAKVKALKNYLKYKPVETPAVTVEPVVVQETPGSPAQQAETNATVGA